MIDRKNVIKGLRLCSTQKGCHGCPYESMSGSKCSSKLKRDALELLKDQETTFDDYYGDYKCSACKTIIKSEIRYMADNINYCPSCGRKVKRDD